MVKIRFSLGQRQLDIWGQLSARQHLYLPGLRPCRRQGLRHRAEDLAAPGTDQYCTYLHARVPRVACPGGYRVRQVQASWARPGSDFTLYFEGLIMLLAQDMPVKAIAELVGEHDTRSGRILLQH